VIRVVLVDDHAMVRQSLARMLAAQGDLDVVGQASAGEAGAALAAELAPDVAVVDLAMPGMDGIEATRRIRAASPGTHVVVLTAFSDRVQVLSAVEAGAIGYLLKDAEPEDLIAGVRAAARGEQPLDPRAEQVIRTRDAPGAQAALRPREREVLGLVAEGLPNKQIARRLGISEKTVKAHLTRVFEAVGVTDRTAAALWAHRNGLGPPRAGS
jgi:DNA-binding NarL/FixJ family response regulator